MIRFLTSGESHGPGLTAILEGIPAGLAVSLDKIDKELARRQKGYGSGGRMKIEKDKIKILGGIMEGTTTGGPIAMWVENIDHPKWQGKEIPAMTAPRPGHADLTGAVKYGFDDLRPALERASARETVMRVAVGAICKQFLSQFGILVGGYVLTIGDITCDPRGMSYTQRFERAETSEVRCPDQVTETQMRKKIKEIMQDKDTLGGIMEIVSLGVPIGLGSYAQWDRRLDARLGAAILSVQAIKGVEIGDAWENSRLPGTQAHDAIIIDQDASDGSLNRSSNRAGGIEGGISNGQPIVIRAAMKPIATTLKPQNTVDLASGETVPTRYERSDFCPVPRAVPILEAMTAYVLADALAEKLGGDSLDEMKQRFNNLRKARSGDLPLKGEPRVWWN
jgi:chorismate synthase